MFGQFWLVGGGGWWYLFVEYMGEIYFVFFNYCVFGEYMVVVIVVFCLVLGVFFEVVLVVFVFQFCVDVVL